MEIEKIVVLNKQREYKTSDAVRRALDKYRKKNSVHLNAKNLEQYHENMKNEEYREKKREYDRNRKRKKKIKLELKLEENVISLGKSI